MPIVYLVTEEHFGRLVRRIESSAQRGYTNYLRRTWLLGWIGVGLPMGLALACCAIVVAAFAAASGPARIIWGLALLPAAAPAYLLARTLFVRWPLPAGVRLEPEAFPALFALLERLRREQHAPLPDAVYLDGSFNAAVAQQPLRGIFGRRRIFLTLGLPLLDSLSPAQCEAVLAHEFGHIGSGSGRMTTQIYALRLSMEKLASRPFYRRFTRYFDSYSCVAARRVEIDADRAAASQVGNVTFASALVAVNVQNQRVDRDFWQPLATELETFAGPPLDIYDRIAEVAARPLDDAAILLNEALAVASKSGDSHPSLAERLRALAVAPEVAVAPLCAGALRETGSSATAYLGSGRAAAARVLGARWAANRARAWTSARDEREERLSRLAELEGREAPLSREESHERMRLAYAVERADVEDLARAALARDAGDAVAQFFLGLALADRREPEGVLWLERAIEADDDAVEPAGNRAIALLIALGRVAEAERFADRMVARLEAIETERRAPEVA